MAASKWQEDDRQRPMIQDTERGNMERHGMSSQIVMAVDDGFERALENRIHIQSHLHDLNQQS